MVEKSYMWTCQTTKAKKIDWKQLDVSDKIKVQERLEFDKNCSIDVELVQSNKVVDVCLKTLSNEEKVENLKIEKNKNQLEVDKDGDDITWWSSMSGVGGPRQRSGELWWSFDNDPDQG